MHTLQEKLPEAPDDRLPVRVGDMEEEHLGPSVVWPARHARHGDNSMGKGRAGVAAHPQRSQLEGSGGTIHPIQPEKVCRKDCYWSCLRS